jgi:hypothetical protein
MMVLVPLAILLSSNSYQGRERDSTKGGCVVKGQTFGRRWSAEAGGFGAARLKPPMLLLESGGQRD